MAGSETHHLLALPTFVVGWLVSLVKRLDAWGLLPRAFIDSDPLFAEPSVRVWPACEPRRGRWVRRWSS